jgi:ribosomal protein S24E
VFRHRAKIFTAFTMVDVASITVAVISLVASFGVAVASGVLTIYSDERKLRRETERLLRKYRDPLLLGEYNKDSRFIEKASIDTPGSQRRKICNREYGTSRRTLFSHIYTAPRMIKTA